MKKWTAWVLSFCFIATLATQWLMLDVIVTEDGLWHFELTEVPPAWVSLVNLLTTGVTLLLGVAVFPRVLFKGRYQGKKRGRTRSLQPRDAVDALAWLQVSMVGLAMVLLSYNFLGAGVPASPAEAAHTAQIWMFFIESYVLQIAILATFFFMGTKPAALGWIKPHSWLQMVGGATLLYALYFFLVDPLVTIPVADFFRLDINSWRDTEIFHTMDDLWNLGFFWGFFDLLMISVVTGCAEEILFRGYIQGALVKRWGAIGGVLLTSLFFALIHADPIAFAPIFVLSLLLGYLKQRYRTLWAPIYLHAVNNGISSVFTLFTASLPSFVF